MHDDISHYKKIVETGLLESINQDNEETQIHKVSTVHSGLIGKIDNPSEAVQLAAVTRNGLALKILYEKGIKPSEAVQLAAVAENSAALNFIPDPSDNVKLSAVERDEYAILNLLERKLSNEKLLMTALNKDVFMVDKIEDNSLITPAVKRLILSKLLHFIKLAETDRNYIKEARDLYLTLRYKGLGWPEFATLEKHLKAKNILKESLSEEDNIVSVTLDPESIEHVDNPSEAVQLAAIKQYDLKADRKDPWFEDDANKFLAHFKNPTETVQLAMVKLNGSSIEYIVNQGITPSEAVQLAAIEEDPFSIGYIKTPSEHVQLAALDKNPETIESIRNPTENVQLAAIQHGGIGAVGSLVDNGIKLSPRVQMEAIKNNAIVMAYFKNGFDVNNLLKNTEFKRATLQTMIQDLKNNIDYNALTLYKFLKERNINWPELEIIKSKLLNKNLDWS